MSFRGWLGKCPLALRLDVAGHPYELPDERWAGLRADADVVPHEPSFRAINAKTGVGELPDLLPSAPAGLARRVVEARHLSSEDSKRSSKGPVVCRGDL